MPFHIHLRYLWLGTVDCGCVRNFRESVRIWTVQRNVTSPKVRKITHLRYLHICTWTVKRRHGICTAIPWQNLRTVKGASWRAFHRFISSGINFGLTGEKRPNRNWNVWWLRTWSFLGPRTWTSVLFKTLATGNMNAVLGFHPTSSEKIVATKWRYDMIWGVAGSLLFSGRQCAIAGRLNTLSFFLAQLTYLTLMFKLPASTHVS